MSRLKVISTFLSLNTQKQEVLSQCCLKNRRVSEKKLVDFDVSFFQTENPAPAQAEKAVRQSPENYPSRFPDDVVGHSFPVCLLHTKLTNGENVPRDWLVWSKSNQALFCFPCRLFSKLTPPSRSALASTSGYSFRQKWKRLHEKIPEHQNSSRHKMRYIEWHNLEKHLKCDSTVDQLLLQSIQSGSTLETNTTQKSRCDDVPGGKRLGTWREKVISLGI